MVTVAAHTSAGGSIDPLSASVVVTLSVALAAGIAHRRLGLARLLAAVLGAQAVLHLVMTVAGPHAMHAGQMHTGQTSLLPMIGTHLLAALATAVVVLQANALLDAWQRLVRTALGSEVRLPRIPEGHSTYTTAGPTFPILRTLRHRVARRGPPRALHVQTV